jgi:GNAT superfamily N-acetyltransferase
MDLIELYVEQAWRNKGVAASLIASLLEIAKQRNIHSIRAEVHAGNSAIEHMLESAGFDPEHRTVWGLSV